MKTMRKTVLIVLTAALTLGIAMAVPAAEGSWRSDERGWRFQASDGTYLAGVWMENGGAWYHFDQDGYMQTGWYQEGENWYYLEPANGIMISGTTRNIDGTDYTFDGAGALVNNSLAAVTTPRRGEWQGNNTFVNAWANYQITFPAEYTAKELGDVSLGGGFEGEIEDFSVYSEAMMNGMVVFYIDRLDSKTGVAYTADSFLAEVKKEFDEDGGEEYSTGVIVPVTIGGYEYKRLDITMMYIMHVDLYCRQIGDKLMVIMPVYYNGQQEMMNSILGTVRPVN